MDKRKLNFRFHNPNRTEDLLPVLLRTCIEANMKKAEQAIRECAVSDGKTYRVITLDRRALIVESEQKTLFKMPKGAYFGKGYSIPNEYVKVNTYECVLELPQDFKIELSEKGGRLTVDEFVREVVGKNETDYESPFMPPGKIAAKTAPKKYNRSKNQMIK